MDGYRISIRRVPFIIYGEARFGQKNHRFSGVILDERLVLTTAYVCTQ